MDVNSVGFRKPQSGGADDTRDYELEDKLPPGDVSRGVRHPLKHGSLDHFAVRLARIGKKEHVAKIFRVVPKGRMNLVNLGNEHDLGEKYDPHKPGEETTIDRKCACSVHHPFKGRGNAPWKNMDNKALEKALPPNPRSTAPAAITRDETDGKPASTRR